MKLFNLQLLSHATIYNIIKMNDQQKACQFAVPCIEAFKEELSLLLRARENLRQAKLVCRPADYFSIAEALTQMKSLRGVSADACPKEARGTGGQILKEALDSIEQIMKNWGALDPYMTLIPLTKLSSSVKAAELYFTASSPLTYFLKSEHSKIRILYRFFFEGVVKSFEDRDFKSPMSYQTAKLNSPHHEAGAPLKRQPSHLELDPMDFSKVRSAPEDPLQNTRMNFSQKRPHLHEKPLSSSLLSSIGKHKNTSSFSVGDRQLFDSTPKRSIKKSMITSTHTDAAEGIKESFSQKSDEQKRSLSLRLGTVIHQIQPKLDKSLSKSRIFSETDFELGRAKSLVAIPSCFPRDGSKRLHPPSEKRTLKEKLSLCSSPLAWYASMTQPRNLHQPPP